jgi:hypothetical protein
MGSKSLRTPTDINNVNHNQIIRVPNALFRLFYAVEVGLAVPSFQQFGLVTTGKPDNTNMYNIFEMKGNN